MVVSIVMGDPQARWMVFVRKNPNLQMDDDLGDTPMTQETSSHHPFRTMGCSKEFTIIFGLPLVDYHHFH